MLCAMLSGALSNVDQFLYNKIGKTTKKLKKGINCFVFLLNPSAGSS